MHIRALCLALAAALCTLPRVARAHPGSGIVVDRNGRVYFVVGGGDVVTVIEPDGRVRTLVQDELLRLPHHLVLGADGTLYVASDYDGKVWRVTPDGRLREFFNSNRIVQPTGIHIGSWGDPFTIDSAGNIYALASPRGRGIVRIDRDAKVTPVAPEARFGDLHFSSMAWGATGDLYVTDGSRVWRIVGDRASIVIRAGTLAMATGISIDRAGNVYVADYGGGRVLRFGSDGRVNTPAALARLSLRGPTGVTLGPNGEVYVLDNDPQRVAVWRVRGDNVERLYRQQEWQTYLIGALMTLLPLLLAMQTWVRKPRSTPDWLVWTLTAGVAIVALYWIGAAIALFSWTRHLILAVYAIGAWKSYRRLRPTERIAPAPP